MFAFCCFDYSTSHLEIFPKKTLQKMQGNIPASNHSSDYLRFAESNG